MMDMDPIYAHLLLTPLEMAAVDRSAARSGIASYGLMEKAGQAVAAAALRRFPGAARFVVFCGPGNNGGDGYVAARALRQAGAAVALFYLGDPARLRDDAATARACCGVAATALEDYTPLQGDVIVDAVFGAGLDRPVPAAVADLIGAVTDADLPVLAVDLPSGVDGRSGAVLGAAFSAVHTVSFMARKPGHLLLPGRALAGEVEVFDIGIPRRIVTAEAGALAVNDPAHWRHRLPRAGAEAHKFSRGHLGVFSGGPNATGGARLSATAGLRAGAGLVTLAAPQTALPASAAHLTAVMLRPLDNLDDLTAWLADPRLSAFVLGPGFGISDRLRDFALALGDRRLVLDADGITAFKDDPPALFAAFKDDSPHLVLTPHEGEFARLFADIAADKTLSKVDKARSAASRAHAVIVYKGADSVIASPDGRALVNDNAPPYLATAGSGDVLSGIIGGLLAQGMPAFEAAAAGVFLHGDAASRAGAGMTAEDLVAAIRPL